MSELIRTPDGAGEVHTVLDSLADAPLVTLADGTVEVAPEALIRSGRPARLVESGSQALRRHRQLSE